MKKTSLKYSIAIFVCFWKSDSFKNIDDGFHYFLWPVVQKYYI